MTNNQNKGEKKCEHGFDKPNCYCWDTPKSVEKEKSISECCKTTAHYSGIYKGMMCNECGKRCTMIANALPQSNTLGTIIDWEEKFKEEFGIHFKESSGELQFAIAFISNLLQQERDKVIKWIDKRCEDNIKASGTDKWNEDMEDLKAKLNKE